MSKTGCIISHEGIEYLCGLIRDISGLDTKLIDDLNIKSNGTFSSLKVNALLKTLKEDCNEYSENLCSNLSRLELKLVTDEIDIKDSNILYLYQPIGQTSYNQYVVIEGNKILLGTTDINMSDYYTITQSDNKFVLKTDFDSLNTKVSEINTNLTTHIDNANIHITSDERTAWNNKVDKGNQYLTNKTTLGGQADIMCWDDTVDDSTHNYCAMSYYLPNGDIRRIQQDNASDNIWFCTLDHITTTWSTKKICATNTSNIAKTTLSLNSTTAFSEGTITYNVTNGVCDLTLAGITNSLCSAFQLSTISFPTPKNDLITIPIVNDTNGEIVGMFYIDANYNSIPTCHIYKTSSRGFCTISYTVAEN